MLKKEADKVAKARALSTGNEEEEEEEEKEEKEEGRKEKEEEESKGMQDRLNAFRKRKLESMVVYF